MLKNINPLLTGSLLSILADMGHGDDLVIVDANYPAQASGVPVLDFPGISATAMAEAVLSVLPLDDFVDMPAAVMQAPNETPAIYGEFEEVIAVAEGRKIAVDPVERFAFYARATEAFAVIRTGERRLYGNIIFKKGVIRS
ncbi:MULTISPECIES: RbsD/FucU family protein [Brucella/Ochrobactrum group]|uniref:RbsD/FucU transport protein family n=2 Tax=Ochrobactrum TaxID=528 RepID=A0A2P9HNT9_9HYPH|nr:MULTISPECIES: RbsD/FucU domain-containing protein [Brucella]MCI1001620.1 ribose ABC transporter [Ochrobactrum sp. C6C9]RRD22097.1 ribose ABC transporter [Brucellaceae bacterium VT-16-1752]WHT42261.1 RbsD/FucU domain-containing protein [Ochrobactrum sp. SSR]MDX4072436.1 RbsD/FucU domain-containing protein [Brucella sp. NBRC 113783]NNU61339.1 ribose ABC transporter [[Ochrobactrum] soli]